MDGPSSPNAGGLPLPQLREKEIQGEEGNLTKGTEVSGKKVMPEDLIISNH